MALLSAYGEPDFIQRRAKGMVAAQKMIGKTNYIYVSYAHHNG